MLDRTRCWRYLIDVTVCPSDPVEIEVFRHLLASIAEEMGETLRRTGFSPNIKERRDYSAAIFDGRGQMVAQAAHLPVHLGSMPLSVQAAIQAVELVPGDEIILNDPYSGGTHLPDITLVQPVFVDGVARPAWFVANRAHHADVGGKRPGSMVLSDHIDDEGLRLPPQRLTESVIRRLLGSVRTPHEREGDLAAQRASNAVGERRLRELLGRYSVDAMATRSSWLLDHSEAMMRSVLRQLPDGVFGAEDFLDGDGLSEGPVRLVARLEIQGDEVEVDFSQSDPQVKGPMNAVYAITLSAAAYCFRCIAPMNLPTNEGYMRPIRVIAPEGCVLNARYPAPVFGGNVETSQRVVDVVFRALQQALPERIPAASCGTMNNVTFGGEQPESGLPFAYYETLAGGTGGGPPGPGSAALHSHMTNTLNTPIEVLERLYPLRLDRYSIRRGSGGAGLHAGGDGLIREYRFLAPAEVTLLTERRSTSPWGAQGGAPGAPGRNVLIRGGEDLELDAKVALSVVAGESLRVETPGGGGWGSAA